MVGAQRRHEPEFERVESQQIDSLKHPTDVEICFAEPASYAFLLSGIIAFVHLTSVRRGRKADLCRDGRTADGIRSVSPALRR